MPPLCRTSQHRRTCVPLPVQWADLCDSVFNSLGLVSFKSRSKALLMAQSALSFCCLIFLLSLVGCGIGVFVFIECFTLSQSYNADSFLATKIIITIMIRIIRMLMIIITPSHAWQKIFDCKIIKTISVPTSWGRLGPPVAVGPSHPLG